MSSIPGWCNETATSGANVELQSQGYSLSTDLANLQENSQETSSDSVTASSRGTAGKPKHNGEHLPPLHLAGTPCTTQEPPRSVKGPDRAGEPASLQPKAQERRIAESSSDEERTITTRVIRRRVILKGEDARNAPSDSVTEQQFIDKDGNLITRKIIRRVIRRVVVTPNNKDGGGGKRLGESKQGQSSEEEGNCAKGAARKAEVGTEMVERWWCWGPQDSNTSPNLARASLSLLWPWVTSVFTKDVMERDPIIRRGSGGTGRRRRTRNALPGVRLFS
ncbi:hypothetical protein AAFF_G00135950 [Aldrovandia affinis]|uniref:Uncharacterized protein n=1 Tax=Aldrovandia affinis TaxID=143900 RepID=A0AAD7RPZ3_9TELE|nr:hypothetical protein AAFF_G00135950 [Aldrovandia affinis]